LSRGLSIAEPIAFRRLEHADLPLMRDWLNRPHLRRFYQKAPIALDQVRAEYGPVIRDEEPGLAHLALVRGGRPFGYAQCYRLMDWPDYAAEIGVGDGVSMDYFIAQPELIGCGLGKAMLAAYLADVVFPTFPDEQRCVVCHERANQASGGVLRSLGFAWVRDLVEGGEPSRMMVLERRQS
jgi:aminoglycoside 6'-N-acetyltransferase